MINLRQKNRGGKIFFGMAHSAPLKPPDDIQMDLDSDEDTAEIADEGHDNIALADEGDDNIDTKCKTVAKKEVNDDDEYIEDNVNEVVNVAIGDIPWGLGYSDSSADEDYQPDYIISDRPPPHTNTSGNKIAQSKTKISTEVEDELFCKLCFTTGQPLSITTSHHSLHISCPSMTDEEKEQVYGPNWVARMYGYPADPP